MMTDKVKLNPEEMRCATCGIRRRAEANPKLIMARVWKWHTGWCPGWKAYQNALADAGEGVVQVLPSR
ncbi:MAG: hypothetical protein P8Z00_19080 [Anaerolineales bacterium]|jgi:hypothetical protein